MKKMPTLFKREFNEKHEVTIRKEVTKGCEWVLDGDGIATRKFDGSCCAIIEGKFFKRFDAKKGKPIPVDAILCQEEGDEVTGHLPCWVPVKDNSEDKWFNKALEKLDKKVDGTFEAVGPHFNSNPDGFEEDQLIKHGETIFNVERNFEGIKEFLSKNKIEGIVFHRGNGEMCKIKRSDFGLEWQAKRR